MAPPIDVAKMPAAAPAAARTPTAAPAEQGPRSPANAAPLADRADIRPLDIPAALQILLAEVRAAFEMIGAETGANASESMTGLPGLPGPSGPPQTAHALLLMLLGAMPDERANMPAWTAALTRLETALHTGLDRGIDAVTVWRSVPPIVVDAAKEARALVLSALSEDSPSPAWLRLEWAGLGPRLERFWRRRRLARRHLTDPDYSSGSFDEDSERRS